MRVEDLPTNDAWGDGDWRCVFPAVRDEDYSYYEGVTLVHGHTFEGDMSADRIARVDLWDATGGEWHSEATIHALVELVDGTWATLYAGCDTTGWGCQQWVDWHAAPTRDDAIRLGLSAEARRALGVPLSGEEVTEPAP